MAQNEIWTCWKEIVEKHKIFEKSISSQIFTVNMTRFHIETITQVVKISTQFFITMHMDLQYHCDEKLSGNLYDLRNCLNMKSSHVHSKNLAGNGFFKNLDFFENFLPAYPNFILSHCSEFKYF